MTNDQRTILSVKNLGINFGTDTAVKNASFNLEGGKTLALVGESGSGKSSIALSVLQLLPYPHASHTKESSIKFCGQEIINANEKLMRKIRGRRIGMIFQEPLSALNPLHTIYKQISEVLKIHGKLSGGALKIRIEELLDMVELPFMRARLKALPHELSGGQRQRVMIAMALAMRPELLIADEPTTALDVTVQAQILKLLSDLQERLGMAMLMITHDLSIVERMAKDTCIMRNGEIVEARETEKILSAPHHDYTKMLLRARNMKPPSQIKDAEQEILKAQNVVVRFPLKKSLIGRVKKWTHAVKGVSLSLNKGQTLGIVGESGSGKTTLGLAILRLTKMDGDIIFNGKQIPKTPNKGFRSKAQIVFQDPFSSLSPRMSVGDIVAEGLRVHAPNISKLERGEKVENALKAVKMKPSDARKYPHEFSGGQRQRISIARAIILNPSILILDEPTSALDLPVQAQILDVLKDLQGRFGLSYVFISHDIAVVKSMSHQIAVMKDGEIVEQGRADQVFKSPQNDYTKTLLAAA